VATAKSADSEGDAAAVAGLFEKKCGIV
jgi:hypothetical protein